MIADLYTAHAAELRAYAVRHGASQEDADDLVQTAFLKMLDGSYTEQGYARAWLYQVVRCRWIDMHRAATRHPAVSIDAIRAPSYETTERVLDRLDAVDRWQAAALTAEQQWVVWLRHVEGLGFCEIAERMGRTHGAVKSLCHRALTNLATR